MFVLLPPLLNSSPGLPCRVLASEMLTLPSFMNLAWLPDVGTKAYSCHNLSVNNLQDENAKFRHHPSFRVLKRGQPGGVGVVEGAMIRRKVVKDKK